MKTKLKIALIGTRGVPASHGGFETCVEEIGQRLAAKKHTVYIYSQKNFYNKDMISYLGMNIIKIPRLNINGFDTLFASFLSVLHSLFLMCDFHMVFNGANSPSLLPYKLLRKKYALNTDGLEWKREKWGFVGRNYYKISERISALIARHLVSDSQCIHDYYLSKYGRQSTIIAYGATVPGTYPDHVIRSVLEPMGLQKKGYVLQVTRFEPENNPLLTMRAFKGITTDLKCVIVGGATTKTDYLSKMFTLGESSTAIVLPGFIYEKERIQILMKNSFCYIHGNSVGGTNPALLQAMAAGRPVIALDCIFNRETLKDCGYFFKKTEKDLRDTIQHVIVNHSEAIKKSHLAQERIITNYTWDLVTDKYENLFRSLL